MITEEKRRQLIEKRKEVVKETSEAALELCGFNKPSFDSRKCDSCLWCCPEVFVDDLVYVWGDDCIDLLL